jgi:molybdopterin-containing oxidoreductase family iron-sulfur binding subunit
MSAQDPRSYWTSPAERDGSPSVQDEFPEGTDRQEAGLSRRGFLEAVGFALAGVAVSGCGRAPVEQVIPYVEQPEEATPGRPVLYASTCAACSAGCGLLVKCRDGRPIKLEGNPDHPLSRGGLCAVGQATLLGLYDRQRLSGPRAGGASSTWKEVDGAIRAKLEAIRAADGAVCVLTGSLVSPTLRAVIGGFLGGFANGRHVVYDTPSCSAILDAHERTHGVRVLPRCHLDRAEVIVGLDADFLGTWVSPVEFAHAYAVGRTLQGAKLRLSYHVQFEARMSLTGSKADQRLCVAPGEIGLVLTHLAARLARRAGVAFTAKDGEPPVPARFLDHLAECLWRSRKRSVVLCGSPDVGVQVLANFVNHLLDAYGATLDLARPSYQCQGNDRELQTLLAELHAGKVAALFVYRSNPVFDLPGSAELAAALKKVPLLVSCAERLDETAALAGYVCPDHHPLESWGDAEPAEGVVSLLQPAVRPLGNTRSVLESFAAWSGEPKSARDILRDTWQAHFYPRRTAPVGFPAFWDQTLHDGYARLKAEPVPVKPFDRETVGPLPRRPAEAGSYTLLLYPKVGLRDGSHAYNPWLQELPDPISKVTWDNYACLSPGSAAALNVADSDVIRLEVGEGQQRQTLELPAFVQPGQHDHTVAVALGYGSKLSERFAQVGPRWLEGRPGVGPNGLVGSNAAPLLAWQDGTLRTSREGVKLVRTGKKHPLASTQAYHSVSVPARLALPGTEQRPIVRTTTLQALPLLEEAHKKDGHGEHPDLWPDDHPIEGARWGMAIDLNACTGCSGCVVACQAENNIPVVGRDEVRRRRDMHWLRIDRYYSGTGGDVEVVHQPMLCQHCGNAPCEVVCPVLATVHSSEGLNQQVYNRCVGTRYCANNCPFKVRRFNWFAYAREDALQNLVLNPDVTVRSRGVMEKCTFCVQRIQEARIEVKRLGQPLADGAIQTACQQSCPTGAIVFGDLNDPQSRAARLAAGPRGYRVLAELNVKPAVTYLTLVRNRPAGKEGEGRG